MLCLNGLVIQLVFWPKFFNSASKQHHEVWASQFPILDNIKDSLPPIEAYLYGCIKWSLSQAHRASSLRLSQCCLPLWGVSGPGEGLESSLMFTNSLWKSVMMSPLQRSLTLILSLIIIMVAGSQQEVHWQVPLTLRKMGAMGVVCDVLQSSSSSWGAVWYPS